MSLIIRLLINAGVLLGIAYLLPQITVESFYIALILAVVLGLLNLFFKPVLVMLTLPINLVLLGLFTLIINGFLFWFASTFVKGFEVENFWWAIVGALIFSAVSTFANGVINNED